MSALYLSGLERGCGAAGFPPRRLGAHPVFASLRPASLGPFTAKKALENHCCPTVSCPLTSTEKRLRAVRPAVSLCRCGPRPSSLRFATPGKPGSLHSEKCPEKRSFFAVQRRSLIAAAQANCRPPLAVVQDVKVHWLRGSRPVSRHPGFMSETIRKRSKHRHLRLIEYFRWGNCGTAVPGTTVFFLRSAPALTGGSETLPPHIRSAQ